MSPNVQYQMPEEAFRLVLVYREERITLDEIQRVHMRLPPSDELPEHEPDAPLSGFWYELQTENGEVLYRQITSNPIHTWVDIPDEENPTRLVHQEIIPEEKIFVLCVPAFREGAYVVMYSSPLYHPSVAAPAEPMWRVPLQRDRIR